MNFTEALTHVFAPRNTSLGGEESEEQLDINRLKRKDIERVYENMKSIKDVFAQQQDLMIFMARTAEALKGEGYGGTISQILNRIQYKIDAIYNLNLNNNKK